jgi:hypothetical protein
MGQRISFRRRAERGDIFANLPAFDPSNPLLVGEPGIIPQYKHAGPFTRNQLIELMFRVKKITGSFSTTYTSYGPEPDYTPANTTTSESLVMVRSYPGGVPITEERRLIRQLLDTGHFANTSDVFDPTRDIFSIVFNDSSVAYGSIKFYAYLGLGPDGSPRTAKSLAGSIKQLDGNYYLPVWGLFPYFTMDSTPPSGGSIVTATLTINFSDGSHVNIDAYLKTNSSPTDGFTAGSASIHTTEWYSYVDKSGADAFDSTTGLPVNGGPGG